MVKDTRQEKNPAALPLAPGNTDVLSRWGDWRTWLNIVFLFLTLWVAVYSIERARWIDPQPSLTAVLLLAIIAAFLLNVSRFPAWLAHIAAIITGLLVMVWQGISILPGGAGISRIFSIFNSWLQGGAGLGEEEAKAIFGITLVIITWLAGYFSAWFVLRRHNAWVAVSFGLIIIIVNLSNVTEKNYLFFTLYLLAATLLLVYTRVSGRGLAAGQSNFSGKSLFYLVISLFCITVLAVSVSWVTPQLRLTALQNALAASMPWKQGLQESDFNILNAVPSKKAYATAAGIQELDFGQYWHYSDDIKYVVKSSQPAYWRVNVYDIYNSNGWATSPGVDVLQEARTTWENAPSGAGKNRLTYEVTVGIGTDVVLVTGEFVSAEMPVITRAGSGEETIAVKSPRVLSPGERYTVRAYVSDASPGDLAAAGNNYPDVIAGTYLQLPPDFPVEITQLSENITRDAGTPYEKVLAIDRYLAALPYSPSVDELPKDKDAVADFLFTQKKGFCLHFASAMTVMLRSIGVPARLAVGYLPGDAGKEAGEYILRDKFYHSWPQVYFPGQGWIDFEPTPSGTEASGSEVYLDNPLISTPEIRQSPEWYGWYYPEEDINRAPRGIPAGSTEVRSYISGRLSFSDELGRAIIIILCGLAALGIGFLITRIVRPLNARRIWYVDRSNLAISAYENLCRLAAMNKLIPEARQTPLEFASMLAEVIPEKSQELLYLVKSYLEYRFGPVKGKPGLYQEAEILKARVQVYNAILERRGKMHKFIWTS